MDVEWWEVRPRGAANETDAGRVALGDGTVRAHPDGTRDARPVDFHVGAVVDVLQEPPEKSVLASAPDAEGRVGGSCGGGDDEAAPGHNAADRRRLRSRGL